MRRAAVLVAVAVLAVAVLVVTVLAARGDDDDGAAATEPGCRDVAAPEPRGEGAEQPPENPLPAGVEHRVQVETSCGEFTIVLDPEASARAAASFAKLVEAGFFDGTTFHRVVPGFVIQGGDPAANGTGGPGYTTVETPAEDTTYTRGTVAMAKAASDPPGTAGSQFFVVTAADAGLPPDYAVIGSVTEGMDVVSLIEALGDRATELPSRPVVVERMTLETG